MSNKKEIKLRLREIMIQKNIGVLGLSKKAHINICTLVYILYMPFSKIKLTKYISICKALGINVSQILN